MKVMVILCCILWFCTSCTFDFDEPQVCPYNVRLNYRYAGRPDAGQLAMYVDNIRQFLFDADGVLVDSYIIAHAPVKFLVAGMGDALGTYFEARACYRTDAPSLENGGITRSAMALCELCYENLRNYGAQAKTAVEHQVVTPALDAIIETNVYLSGVGADNGGLACAHSFYNGITSLGGHSAPHGNCVAFGTLVQLVLEGVEEDEFRDVQGFCKEVGLPTTLAELGITTDEQIRQIAKAACVPGESIHNMVADVTEDQLYAAIIQADALGK